MKLRHWIFVWALFVCTLACYYYAGLKLSEDISKQIKERVIQECGE